jgi:hypothetical protein
MRSIVVTLMLGGLFVAFRTVTSPYLNVEHQEQLVSRQDHGNTVSTELVEQAEKWFPDHGWVANAKKHFHDGGRYLYCRDFGLTDNDRSVTVTPIAMILHGKPGERPVTIVADSARLESSTPISPNASEFGRIVGGVLSGNVRIEGPRGLRIEGTSFQLDERTLKLWSSDPVTFQADEHRGVAKRGVDIYLSPSTQGDGLMDVTEVRQVRLNGRVTCHFVMPATRVDEEDQELQIEAAGGFSFEVLTRTGAFSGLPPAKGEKKIKTLRNEVVVTRLSAGKVTDQLVCPELLVRFRGTLPSEDTTTASTSMQLEHVKAWGRQVVYLSRVHDVTVVANELSYALAERRIDIYRHSNGAANSLTNVQVEAQNRNKLQVPHIRILHTPAGGIQRVEFNGKGKLTGHPEPKKGDPEQKIADKPVAFEATWLKSLTMQMGADELTRVVSLTGGASISETSSQFQLAANTIAMKLISTSPPDTQQDKSAVDESGRQVSRVSYTKESSVPAASGFEISTLRPQLMTAEGNVILKSPEGNGQLRNKLKLKFEDILAASPVKTAASTPSSKSSTTDKDGKKKDQISFTSDNLEAVVGISVDPENKTPEFKNLWLNGDVEIVRQSANPANSFTATGNTLHATGRQVEDLEIKLFGDPAKFSSGARKLEGQRIDLAAENRQLEIKVGGSGRIRFTTDKGFDKRKLAKETDLDIFWSDHMVLHKRSAKFVGNIRVVMKVKPNADMEGTVAERRVTQDVEMTCAGMTVYFTKDIVLEKTGDDKTFDAIAADGSDGTAKESPDIERIECHNTVKVSVKQWLDDELVGRHGAEFADLNVNMITGDFNAIGRGFLESVSPDEDGKMQGPAPATARANTPAQTSENAFVYLRVEFIGDLTGNLDRGEANLTHNVMALVAPARHIDDQINMDVPTSELPERAGILLSELLTISAIDRGSKSENSFEIVARDNARLRSRVLSASGADEIKYDHQKQQFIMKAEGNGTVRVNHLDVRSNKVNTLSGKHFEFYRPNRLVAEGFGGLQLEE